MNFYKKVFQSVAISFLLFQFSVLNVFANLVDTKLDTATTSVKVGDIVSLKLNINPVTGTPVFTVSTTLKYDPSMLEIEDTAYDKSWVSLSQEFRKTDRINGILTRTAGQPGGLTDEKTFITYNFKALKNGTTSIKIVSGNAYNENNTDVGINGTQVDLTIGDKVKDIESNTLSLDLSLNIKGDNAIYKQRDYTFDVYQKAEPQDGDAITKIWVLDNGSDILYQDEKLWRTGSDSDLAFVIPADTLEEGNYNIIARTRFEDGSERTVAQKSIGVLSNGENWFTKNKNLIIPLFTIIVVAGLIHHFATEMELYNTIAFLRRKDDRLEKLLKNKKRK